MRLLVWPVLQYAMVYYLLGFIGYLLKTRFSDAHASAFKLSCFIPSYLATLSRSEYADANAEINDVYSLENLAIEAMTWYNFRSVRTQKPANVDDALLETDFYPVIMEALMIGTKPATTCSV